MSRSVQNLRDACVAVHLLHRLGALPYALIPLLFDRSPRPPDLRHQPRRSPGRSGPGGAAALARGAAFPVHRVFLQASRANVLASNRPHRLTVKSPAPQSGNESTHTLFCASVTSGQEGAPATQLRPKAPVRRSRRHSLKQSSCRARHKIRHRDRKVLPEGTIQ